MLYEFYKTNTHSVVEFAYKCPTVTALRCRCLRDYQCAIIVNLTTFAGTDTIVKITYDVTL